MGRLTTTPVRQNDAGKTRHLWEKCELRENGYQGNGGRERLGRALVERYYVTLLLGPFVLGLTERRMSGALGLGGDRGWIPDAIWRG